MKSPHRPSILTSFLLIEGVLLYFFGKLLGFRWLLGALAASAALGASFCWRPVWPLRLISKCLRREYLPQGEAALYESLTWVVAGIFLMVPGFLGDVLAILILLPWTRRRVIRGLFAHVFPGTLSFFGEMTWNDWLCGSGKQREPPHSPRGKEEERIRDAEFEVLPGKDSSETGR